MKAFLSFLLIIAYCGCGIFSDSPVYFAREGVDFTQFKYVYIVPAEKYDKFGARIAVQKLFIKTGLEVLDYAGSNMIPQEILGSTLICNLRFIDSKDQSTAIIECKDSSNTNVYIGYGESLSWGKTKEVLKAYEDAFKGFKIVYSVKKPVEEEDEDEEYE